MKTRRVNIERRHLQLHDTDTDLKLELPVTEERIVNLIVLKHHQSSASNENSKHATVTSRRRLMSEWSPKMNELLLTPRENWVGSSFEVLRRHDSDTHQGPHRMAPFLLVQMHQASHQVYC